MTTLERGVRVVLVLSLTVRLMVLQCRLRDLQREARAVIPVLDQTRGGQQVLVR